MRTGFNSQISPYMEARQPKEHEILLAKMIYEDNYPTDSNILDIACASGSFLRLIKKQMPKFMCHGFDISEKLVNKAIAESPSDFKYNVSDALTFSPSLKFDLITASGILSVFEDLTPLKKWTSWLKPEGSLYIFGRFNSCNVDTIVRFRNNTNNDGDWEGGLTSYSVNTVTELLDRLGYDCVFKRFTYSGELRKDLSDPMRTFSITDNNHDKYILNGANIAAEQYFLKVTAKA